MFSLLLIPAIITCGTNIFSYASPILGNNVKAAYQRQFPFVVALVERNYKRTHIENYKCAATLISSKHVLTAAHCIDNNIEEELLVLAGSEELTSCTPHEIRTWESYSTWAFQNNKVKPYDDDDNDIAILTLYLNVAATPNMRPALLPPKGWSVPYGASVSLAGWGTSNSGNISPVLQTATSQPKNAAECNSMMKSFPEFGFLDSREFCTVASPYTLLGRGDSGGPVIYNGDTIIGLNEAICALNIQPQDQINIHIDINFYREFIDEYVSANQLDLQGTNYKWSPK